jgi:glycosyltransferase involved in cell wall biosynthesis
MSAALLSKLTSGAEPSQWHSAQLGSDLKGKSGMAVAFIGPIADEGKPARGGFESANRRTITLLRQRGFDVLELPYPVARGPTWVKALTYLQGYLRIAAALIRQSNAFRLVHITPLRRQFVLPETLLCWLTHSLKKKLLVDLRAGGLVTSYYRRGMLHRKCLAEMVSSADLVTAEGLSYLPFLDKTLKARKVFYLPNFVIVPGKRNERRFDEVGGCVNIVMLGRITPEKGAEVGIAALRILCNAHVPTRLTIIGTASSQYMAFLREQGNGLPIIFTGELDPLQIETRLLQQHIFLFPTRHSGEGHSNALTEAMAAGLVPICSDHGFNRDVVGDSGYILPADATANDYADVLLKAIRSPGHLRELSTRARSRAERLFSDTTVVPLLLEQYKSLTEPAAAA